MLNIGHGVDRLVVEPGEPMGGYADRPDGVDGVLDPLEVHAISVADGGRRFVLVTLDLICVNADVVAAVRAALADVEVDACWVTATHTHASPESGCEPGGAVTPARIAPRIVDACVAAATKAIAAEWPSAVRAIRAAVEGLAGRRSADPSTSTRIPVDALVVEAGGEVRGVLVVSPVHPTVFGADNHAVGADLNGGIRAALAARTGAWVVCATGAAGDISTRHTRTERSPAEVARLGALVADAIAGVVGPGGDGSPDDGSADEAGATLGLPRRETLALLPKSPDERAGLPSLLARDTSDVESRSSSVLRQGATIAAEMARNPRSEPYEVTVEAVRVGQVVLVAVPGELFLSLGESIRTQVAAVGGTAAIVVGYANGYVGYLPTRDAGACYEVLASAVTSGSGERVVDAAVTLAEEVVR